MKPDPPVNGRRPRWRWWIPLLLLGLSTQPGCQIFQQFRQGSEKAPAVFENQQPDLNQVIANLQQQSERVRQVRAEVRVAMDGVPGRLRGTLHVERPDRLRLKAGLLGISEIGVDVGSNEEAFWIWSRANLPGQPPALYYARHEEYRHSDLQEMIPLEPNWIIDALGFVQFDPGDRHEGPFRRPDGRMEIRTYHQSANQQVRVTVIDPKQGWINQQAIYNREGRLIAFVDSIEHEYYPAAKVSLPQRIVIHVFQPDGQKIKLSVDAEEYSLNALYGDPDRLWTMPQPVDVRKIDLTQVGRVENPTISESAPNRNAARAPNRFRDPLPTGRQGGG